MKNFSLQVFILLIVELAIYSSFLLSKGINVRFIVPLTMMILAGSRLLIVLTAFTISWVKRAPRPPLMQINFVQTLRLIVHEWIAMLILFLFLIPLERWLGLRNPKDPKNQMKLPVLFIHGIFSNGGYWWALHRYLHQRQLTHLFTLNISPIFADIDSFAVEVKNRVEQICVETGASQVILVGHSMGGLIARAYFHHHGGKERIAKIITLGSPHHGTFFAYWMGGKNIRQMRPNNDWLNQLNALPSSTVPTISIYSYHDDFIVPQDSSILPDATNIAIAGVGHLAMGFSKEFQQQVYQEIVKTDPHESYLTHSRNN